MSEFKVNSITNKNGSTGPSICGVTTFSGKSGIQVPSGRTGNRAGVGAISNRDGLIFYADAAYSRIGGKDPIHDLSYFGKMGELVNGASVIYDHVGVFLLPQQMILHHIEGRLSSKDFYGEWLVKCTGKRLRYVK